MHAKEAATASISRRAFLARSAAAALAVSGGVLLKGCGKRDATGAAPRARCWPAPTTR
jgi:hypothetical protein